MMTLFLRRISQYGVHGWSPVSQQQSSTRSIRIAISFQRFGVGHFKQASTTTTNNARRSEETLPRPWVHANTSSRLFSTVNREDATVEHEGAEEEEALYPSNDEDDDDQDEHESPLPPPPQDPFVQALGTSIQKTLQKQRNIQSSLLSELEKAQSLESTMKRANLILANLYQMPHGTTVVTVQDWDLDGQDVELTLNSKEYSSAQEEADALFSLAKKMKRGSVVVKELLERVESALEVLVDSEIDFDAAMEEEDSDLIQARLNIILDRLERSSKITGFRIISTNTKQNDSKKANRPGKKKKSTRPEPTFRKFKSPSGCIVLVGRNRRDNEALCFQVSRGDDVWMHSRGCPGAHVLLQIRRGSPRPTDQDFQFAADLAAFYSDARTERKAAVTTADAKHIQKPRGAPLGAVKVRQERETWVGYPENVDEELKVAREQSGVAWDESGSRSLGGKAKNRKYTKEVAKQTQAKKRKEKRRKRKGGIGAGEAEDGSSFY